MSETKELRETKQVSINKILNERRSATREELNNLYLQAVCETTCKDVIELMSEQEIKRLLSIRIMEFWIIQCGHSQSYVIQKVRQLLGINRMTLYNYIRIYSIKL